MPRLVLLLLGGVLILMAACAPFKEAYYLDKEFAKDNQAAWDQMVINRNAPHGDQAPVGLPGISAEEVMDVQNKIFAEKPRESTVFEFNMGN